MIELNLLPKELRKKEKKPLPKIKVIPIAIGIVVFLVAVHGVLGVFAFGNSIALKQLRAKWEDMRPLKEKTDQMSVEITDLEKRVISVRKLAKPTIDWSQMLNGLNQAVTPGIWLFEFMPQAGKGARQDVLPGALPRFLEISGYSLGSSETATAAVAKFISSLKKNSDFSTYFDEIELEVIDTKSVAGQEVMLFKLNCTFKNFGPGKAETKDTKKKKNR